ncbi:DUF2726 domain-containing protein [Rubripirellula reticaptiva]|uniref:DUF2726 domain-containing protein n=1 Tax=Rubripirellula reticaptiva TaxID=2528013 RepID=A0A5C6FAU3_9BACT|nr:DUF2726 domain-containing protein [Rubripirellula reticaptiva]TWU57306.1 hypothetical protein Poly59_02130 [Rubripirellula reticaptiva]
MPAKVQQGWAKTLSGLMGRKQGPATPSVTISRDQFLQTDELEFFHRLVAAIGKRGIVCPKTRAIDVVRLTNASAHLKDAVRLNLKQINFLIIEPRSGVPICAIQTELIQNRRGRLQEDFLRNVLRSADLPLIRISITKMPSVGSIRDLLMPIIENRENELTQTSQMIHGPHDNAARQAGS